MESRQFLRNQYGGASLLELKDSDLEKLAITLSHDLSPFIKHPHIDRSSISRDDAADSLIYFDWMRYLVGPISKGDLERFIHNTTAGEAALRNGEAYLISRLTDNKIRMVDPALVVDGINSLLVYLNKPNDQPLIIRCAVASALVNNVHGFHDGNGRLGRAVFNLLAHRGGVLNGYYIPLKSLYHISMGGYSVRLREAEIFGRWDGLIEYYLRIFEFFLMNHPEPLQASCECVDSP
jgi:hypothetical protein